MRHRLDAMSEPLTLGSLTLENRVVLSPTDRCGAAGGIIDPGYRRYVRRRVDGGVGLVIGEAAAVGHPVASCYDSHAWFHGEGPLVAWKAVIDEVHDAGGKFMPQLWHAGLLRGPDDGRGTPNPHLSPRGPSGPDGWPMTRLDIDEVVEAFGEGAYNARRLGADGIEIHGGHGYLIDQFLRARTNQRTDCYGGNIRNRTRFAVDVIAECRRQVGPDFPIFFRVSQWKQQDHGAKLARTPEELQALVEPLSAVGVDVFDCSTRRYWEPEFQGSAVSLAGWTRLITGKPTMLVGSVGLESDGKWPGVGFAGLLERLERHDCDLEGVGRALAANPDWAQLVRVGAFGRIRRYRAETPEALA